MPDDNTTLEAIAVALERNSASWGLHVTMARAILAALKCRVSDGVRIPRRRMRLGGRPTGEQQ